MILPKKLRILLFTGFTLSVGISVFTIPKVMSAEQDTGLSYLTPTDTTTQSLIKSISSETPVQESGLIPATIPIYNNELSAGWENWSWGSTVNLAASSSVYPAAHYIAFTVTQPWGGMYFHADSAINLAPYGYIRFYLHASVPNQQYLLSLRDSNDQGVGKSFPLSAIPTDSWRLYTIPVNQLINGVTSIKGIIVQDATGAPQQPVYIDDLAFTMNVSPIGNQAPTSSPSASISATPAAIATPSNAATPNATATPVPAPSSQASTGGYTVSNDVVYHNGSPIVLHGVNWFGAETDNHVPHGLWARNYKDMISQMKSLGFNAVRLPFCPATLQQSQVTGIDGAKNPDLADLPSSAVLDKIVSELNNQQMYVLLDHHRPDCQAISDLWYTGSYSQSQWIADLQNVANRYKSLPYFLGIDLKNEPHNEATWGSGNSATDWNTAAETAGQAVLQTDPNILVFVEGIQGDNAPCSDKNSHSWGGNLAPANCTPINPAKIPSAKLVYSPHVYGPDVYDRDYFQVSNFPQNMPGIWDAQFGFLTGKGATVIPGEWGGKFGDNGGNPRDPVLQNALMQYFTQKHLCSSFYWDWNPNSGDTGGILQDDWQTPWQNKVSALQSYYTNCH